MQDDVTDGVKAMIKNGPRRSREDLHRRASYGGYAALAGAAFTPEMYACAISVNGISDLPACSAT
jgi:dipeptidyl aminopeptidase/acylaminoacyl peptidase